MEPIDFLTPELLDPDRIGPLARAFARAPDYLWSALASALATLGLALALLPRRRPAAGAAEPAEPEASDFLIHGAAVQPLTAAARALLDALGPDFGPESRPESRPGAGSVPGSVPGSGRLARLRAHLAAESPGIEADLEALVLYGVAFRRHCQPETAPAFEILGAPRGAEALLSIRPASDEARALRASAEALRRAETEAAFLQAALDRAPLLAWATGRDGQISWANAPYLDRFAPSSAPALDGASDGRAADHRPPDYRPPDYRVPDAFARVVEEVPLTARGGGARRRVALPAAADGEARWYEVNEAPGPGGESFGFALEADDLVAAEASLRRFIETLTETFAHLPIGLAVFDKNRRLGLFNPALTDLVKIDAVWLAGRPSLRDFLERLRETRQMPEQKDFASWRRKITEIEEGARDGAYEENWVTPSGKILRVTGRPHPQGAVAFLIEDISTAIHLERRYRSELELSQATLDRMSEAVAVFDASGMLVFVNSAFETLWDMDPMQGLDGPGVAELTGFWAERCRATPVWGRLREFATGAEARGSWTEALETLDGRTLQLLVAPLPDASALVVFRSLSEERAILAETRETIAARTAGEAREALAAELARAEIEAELEAAAEAVAAGLAAAIPAAPGPEAFQALSAAAQSLRDALVRCRALGAPPRPEADPGAWLAAMLAGRGHSLALTGDAALAEAEAPRRILWALALAATEAAAPGAEIAVSIAADPAGLAVSAEAEAGGEAQDQPEGPALALARRLVAAEAGAVTVESSGGRRLLHATLPLARPERLARSA